MRRVRKDGSLVDVSRWAAPLDDRGGEVSGVIAIFADITKRKRMEEALKASEATYRSFFNAANDGIAVMDMDSGELLDVNQKWAEMTGYTPEEARGLSVVTVFPEDSPDTAQEAWKRIRDAVAEPQLFEWPVKRRNGRLGWAEVNLTRTVLGEPGPHPGGGAGHHPAQTGGGGFGEIGGQIPHPGGTDPCGYLHLCPG